MQNHAGLALFAQTLIEYVEDLFTASTRESFTKVDVLVVLNAVKNDPALLRMLSGCALPGERPK